MYPRLFGCALAAALGGGCAHRPPPRPQAMNNPANPNAPESPISPPSTFLAAAPVDDGAGGKISDMSRMLTGADGMDMKGMDMKGMKMGGIKAATKPSTTQEEPNK